jgi:FAD/FMN-containing dehydrogenase
MATWSNWSGKQTAAPQLVIEATSEADLVRAVRDAGRLGVAVRAVGASHSHSRVAASDGVLVTTDGWQGVIASDAAAATARVRSGTRIYQMGEPLLDAGLALRNQGDIDQQSIAGATATGTHGTGPDLQNLSASVEAVRLVLASGDVVDCSAADEPELFAVARHSLGAVGLVSEISIGVREAYRLHERQWRIPGDEVLGKLAELVAATRHFEFFWYPRGDWCGAKALAETGAPVGPMSGKQAEYVDWSYKVFPSVREVPHTEMEYAVPAAHGPACFAELRELLLRDFPDTWPVEYRTLAADDLWISAASGRPTVTISVHETVEKNDRAMFEAAEAVFRRYDGRPHWGKVHYRSGAELAGLYPSYRHWWEVRDRFDPDGRFVTPELELLRP